MSQRFGVWCLVFWGVTAAATCPDLARLEPHITFLSKQPGALGEAYQRLGSVITSACVQHCVEQLIKQQSLECLCCFWHCFKDELGNDVCALREFAFVLFAAYRSLIDHEVELSAKCTRGSVWTDIIELCIKLDAIPVDRLISLLDECFRLYKKLLEAHPVPADTPLATWQDWASCYWWATLTTGVFLVTLYLKWKLAHHARPDLPGGSMYTGATPLQSSIVSTVPVLRPARHL